MEIADVQEIVSDLARQAVENVHNALEGLGENRPPRPTREQLADPTSIQTAMVVILDTISPGWGKCDFDAIEEASSSDEPSDAPASSDAGEQRESTESIQFVIVGWGENYVLRSDTGKEALFPPTTISFLVASSRRFMEMSPANTLPGSASTNRLSQRLTKAQWRAFPCDKPQGFCGSFCWRSRPDARRETLDRHGKRARLSPEHQHGLETEQGSSQTLRQAIFRMGNVGFAEDDGIFHPQPRPEASQPASARASQ